MPNILLPPGVLLQSKDPVRLAMKDGVPVLSEQVSYPAFFARREDLIRVHPEIKNQSARYGTYVPVLPTSQGLMWNPDWNCFSAFFPQSDGIQFDQLVHDLAKGALSWGLKCPVVEGPESVVGQVMRRYGECVGAKPGKEGFNPTPLMLNHPVARLLSLANDQELKDFRDRELTLLDLAMSHQLWDAAHWLWDKGVRASPAFLEGPYLESLVVASHALQESWGTGFLDRHFDRPAWLATWLNRFEQSGVKMRADPFSTWRQRLLAKNIGDTSPEENPIVDTLPAFWISRSIRGNGVSVPLMQESPLQCDMFDTWVRFFARQGVDLERQAVHGWDKTLVMGFSGYAATQHRPERWEGWQERMRVVSQSERLSLETNQPHALRPPPRL